MSKGKINRISFDADQFNIGEVECVQLIKGNGQRTTLATVLKHRMAFYYWWTWSSHLENSPSLFTVDNHRDTQVQENLKQLFLPDNASEFSDKEKAFDFCSKKLSFRNDTHIHAAAYRGIINNIYVYCRPEISGEIEEEGIITDVTGKEHRIYESSNLDFLLQKFQENEEASNYYFDLDLDFFMNLHTNKAPKKKGEINQELLDAFIHDSRFHCLLNESKAMTFAYHIDYCSGTLKVSQILSKISSSFFSE